MVKEAAASLGNMAIRELEQQRELTVVGLRHRRDL
jgi:hypothetical protein